MGKKVIIIGAGLAGLSAGIYLAREGIETEIVERAPWAGGMCAAWTRRDYRFDGCLSWMAGTKKGDPFFTLYKEVGALTDDTEIFNPAAIGLELDGVLYDVPLEIGQFKNFLLGLSGRDAERIEALCRDIGVMMRSKAAAVAILGSAGFRDMMSAGRGVRLLRRKYLRRTLQDFAADFTSPRLGKLLTRMMPEEYSALAFVAMLGARMAGNGGYPMGGAAGIVGRMAEKYASLGGKLRLDAAAEEITVSGGAAQGIRSGGVFLPADGVVAACDARDTLENMLLARYGHPALGGLLKSAPLFEPLAIVSFGLDKPFGIPYALTCECPEGFNVAPGVKRYGYALRSFDFDPSAAPPGGSSVTALFEAPLGYWKKLRQDNPESYKIQKELLADLIATKIDKRYPGFRDAVCIVDVATPATFTRLTNVYRGSFQGIAPTPAALRTRIKKTLPGLKRFCLCGQWTTPGGGIGAAVADGRTAARIMKSELR
ncbi:Phytoene dehydrogenase-related protein [Sporobacter termitidis DSM 10068]|uniref:Phytoene dehydrogenase-related protein n=1 Tax=Sporobacter termitidis DSM 10068 TaxID=1123282 RepID=A0A1M5Z9P0_9FIRM|nr:NAD(P)/FAD-dependent oxidoreductase [Sporobacter termitidis]SHI20944.1 Phytoene dehydrogenase-related protein [Sporobacter termitidis DSM 10068]